MPDFLMLRAGCGAAVVAMFLTLPAAATDWPHSDIPADPTMTLGVLDNGMRYAIQHNATPSGEVSVRLRIAAGALQEEPAQRGLAHFLEHMAFRGSAHVKDGEINQTLSRLGLRFGSDTNASTGQEETIYQFDLPRSDDATVETALTFSREIASNLTLDPAIAKTEAGVVLSELKLRDRPGFRVYESEMDFLLKDPRATQQPNGDAAIIGAAPVDQIRAYYQAYYRPERATLIIIGDIDPARIEARIKAVFSDWKGAGTAGRDPRLSIPRSRNLETKTYSETGAGNSILLAWLQPPDRKPDNKTREKARLIDSIALRILGRRFQQAATSPARPFTRASASFDQMLQAVKLAGVSVGYEPGKWQGALAAAEKIRLGTVQDGVNQDEVDRAVLELRATFEDRAVSAATRPTRGIVGDMLQTLQDNDVYTSNARDLAAFNEYMEGLSASRVNSALRNIFRGGGPLIFASGDTPIEGGEAALRAAFLDADRIARAAPRAAVQSAAQPWPYTDFGAPGTVASRDAVADLDAQYVRFNNGVRLTIRPSKLRANDVQVSVKVGGGRLDQPRDRATVSWAAGALVPGGLNALSYTDMQRALAGKNYSVAFGIGEDGYVFSGGTTPGDLNTQMQVLAAYVRAPGYRPESFENFRAGYAERLRRAGTDPGAVLQLQMPQLLHDGDMRWASPTAQDVQAAKIEDLRALLSPALNDGPINVTIVGDITPDQAIAAVAATFGAFPARTKARVLADTNSGTHFPATGTNVHLPTPDQASQEIATVIWPTHGRFPDIQDDVTIQLLSAILEERLFARMRNLGAAYVAQVGVSSSKVFDHGYLQALTQLPPGQAAQFQTALTELIADLGAGKITDDDLARARNPAREELRKTRETNGYWLSVLDDTQENPAKLSLARDYDAALQKVTAADIAAAARKYLVDARALRLSAGP